MDNWPGAIVVALILIWTMSKIIPQILFPMWKEYSNHEEDRPSEKTESFNWVTGTDTEEKRHE